jgi:hypothetical protein
MLAIACATLRSLPLRARMLPSRWHYARLPHIFPCVARCGCGCGPGRAPGSPRARPFLTYRCWTLCPAASFSGRCRRSWWRASLRKRLVLVACATCDLRIVVVWMSVLGLIQGMQALRWRAFARCEGVAVVGDFSSLRPRPHPSPLQDNDLYQFKQSKFDLKSIQTPAVARLRDSLYSPTFRDWIRSVTGAFVSSVTYTLRLLSTAPCSPTGQRGPFMLTFACAGCL